MHNFYSRMQRLPKLIEPPALYEAINTFRGGEGGSLRVLDCLFSPGRRPEPEYFRQNFYGKFEQQVHEDDGVQNCFLRFLYSHIPGAIHCNLGMATFPSPSGHDKYSIYPAAIFQNYVQLLGLNSDDHLVFYGRGPFGGMLFASRLYWLFRAYGHSGGLSLLNGGFDAWLQSNLSVESGTVKDMDPVFSKTRGNWTAKTEASSGTITFEELTTNSGKALNTEAILLDARPRAQFEGQESHFDPSQEMPPGCRLPGTLNIPAPELIDSEGKLKGPKELENLIENAGLDIDKMKRAQEKPLVTLCNSGMQASLLATALDIQFGLGERTRVYNGSMLEMQARAPELISEGSMRDDDDKDVQ